MDNDFRSHENQYGLQTVTRMAGLLTRHYKKSTFDLADVFSFPYLCSLRI